jgi:hypothetical protein
MEAKKNKVLGKELLSEKGLLLLEEAIHKKQEALVGKKRPPIDTNKNRCFHCDSDFGYIYIGGKCYCI